jgi:hypothetical protein
MSCSPFKVIRWFGRTYYLHFQDRSIGQIRNQHEAGKNNLITVIFSRNTLNLRCNALPNRSYDILAVEVTNPKIRITPCFLVLILAKRVLPYLGLHTELLCLISETWDSVELFHEFNEIYAHRQCDISFRGLTTFAVTRHLSCKSAMSEWPYSPYGPWRPFQFLNPYTFGRTPWTGDQPL